MALPTLDRWLVERMGVDTLPSPEGLLEWQLARVRDLVAHARTNSPFYADHLAGEDPEAIRTMADLARLPMITPDHVRAQPERMLCVSQDEIARVVTLQSSGTTGPPKRVFHTAEDLEATTEYFARGMANLVEPGQAVLVLMPGQTPGGVGRLLMDALTRIGGRAVAHGVLEDADRAVDHCLAEDAQCIVGPAAHQNLFAHAWARRGLPRDVIRSVLFCWDASPDAVVRNVAQMLGCQVFRHWGMIETGLGGGVECRPGSGLHLREAELLLEIVAPDSGAPLPDGEFGEMVVTMLLRRGMPLIRYRTGDLGRILPGGCGCGSPMRRLDPHVRRGSDGVDLGQGRVTLAELNELLYTLDGLEDFTARLQDGVLRVTVTGGRGIEQRVHGALGTLPGLDGIEKEILRKNHGVPAISGLGKRRIETGSKG